MASPSASGPTPSRRDAPAARTTTGRDPGAPASGPVVIGLDVGTTATKATAFTPGGRAVAGAERPTGLHAPGDGRAEQDPDELRRAALESLRDVVARLGTMRVAGVAVCTAMHGLCALDGAGAPLTPVLTWADARARAQATRLRATDPELHDRTGTPLHPMSPLAKLAWYREEDPATFAAARRWVGLKELVLHALTGTWAIDESVASGTGLWASATRTWDAGALRAAGIDADRLARLVPTATVLPGLTAAAADATGLPRTTPVVVGAGDGPLATVGVGAEAPGVAACSIGTSGALRLLVDRPGIDPDRALFSYALDARRWVAGGAISNGGSVLRWAGDALAPDLGATPEEALLSLAAAVPAGSDGLVMVPSLLAERAPAWTGDARGAYVGLTAGHGRGHLVRAAVEGVGLQLALVLASLRAAGHRVDEVRATGGFARSPFWRQLLTDVLGVPVGFPGGPQGSGLGAALLGVEALGLDVADDDPAGRVPLAETLRPDPDDAATYAALLPVFAELGDALAPGLAALRAAGPRI